MSSSRNMMDPSFYLIHIAPTDGKALALASRLKINLPPDGARDMKFVIIYPIRRLIVTGEDTPENFHTLFGPGWRTTVPYWHEKLRIDVLLCPRPTSFSHLLAEHMDRGCPTWRPRGPSVEEEEILREVRAENRWADRIPSETRRGAVIAEAFDDTNGRHPE